MKTLTDLDPLHNLTLIFAISDWFIKHERIKVIFYNFDNSYLLGIIQF